MMGKKNKQKWFNPVVHDTGWDKDDRPEVRRAMMLKAHGGNLLESARAMQALANINQDRATREAAAKDASYFFKENQRQHTKWGPRYIPNPPYHNGYHPQKNTGRPSSCLGRKPRLRITEHAGRIR